MVIRRPQFGLEAIRITGLGYQLFRLRDVVGPRSNLHRVFHALRRDAFGGRRISIEGHLGERILVDRVGDCLAHLGIVERLLLRVHRQVAQYDRRRRDELEVGLRLQHVGDLIWNGIGEMRFARLHQRGARVVVDDGLPRDRVDLRITLAPIAVESGNFQIIGRLPFDELERTRAHRMKRDVLAAPLLERCGADHHRRRMRELRDERRERRFQRDARRVVVDSLGFGDVVVVEAVPLELVFGIRHAIEVRLHRIGLEIGAVMELDALLELDRIDEPVLAHLVTFGENRNHLHVFVEAEQAFVERFSHCLRQRVVRVVRVGRRERRRHGEHDVLRGEGRGGNERENPQRGSDQGAKRRFHDGLLTFLNE